MIPASLQRSMGSVTEMYAGQLVSGLTVTEWIRMILSRRHVLADTPKDENGA